MTIENLGYTSGEKFVQVTLLNKSSISSYVFPVDTLGFKTYFIENSCTEFDFLRGYPDLGLIPMIEGNNSFVESKLGDKGTLISRKNIYIRSEKKYKKEQEKAIKSWKVLNHFYDKDDNWVKINYYIYKHLVTLKPQEKFSYRAKINFNKINEQSDLYTYYYYPLEKELKYQFFLKICVDKFIYEYLSEKQKQCFRDFIFYTGELQSNSIGLID